MAVQFQSRSVLVVLSTPIGFRPYDWPPRKVSQYKRDLKLQTAAWHPTTASNAVIGWVCLLHVFLQ